MKTQKRNEVQAKRAFTLIEMIGVLAVIAILAALLIPKIFEAINNARINNAVVSYNTVKTAVADHYAKYGSIDRSTNGTAVPPGSSPGVAATATPGLGYYDGTLLGEGFLDKPFVVKIGTNSFSEVTLAVATVIPVASQYDLDGDGAMDVAAGSYVVEAIIQGVPASDAKDVNDRLDGDKPPFSVVLAAVDNKGRVKYDPAVGGGTVRIYVTHR